ncbi:MAG: TraB/GumN family protein [Erythrobacter sp.]|uniref:TraB/GumN family protein n=1 Tax=Erythrobacter sp. TaxID=1042 RepID=UPI0025CEDC0B|nr:TraB/GumN family protein [Erythrobacter sp.]MCL9999935.1 TraB/GumN family protein [Erythrobacter sp.]
MTQGFGAMVLRCAAGIIAPLLLLLAAGCSNASDSPAADAAPPAPLFYEIASADGSVEGWMVGTIHALPAFVPWRTPAIDTAVTNADLLVVEIAALGDGTTIARTFAGLATSPGLPPLEDRLPPDLRPRLAALLARGNFAAGEFAATETWAAALTLARIDATGDPAHGVDRALIAEFKGRRVRELEGARAQLAIFDRLPEAQQRAMLAAVVKDSAAVARDPERLQRAWLAGDAAIIEAATREGVLADPAVREALLTARNRRWAAALGSLLAEAPRPLIAVGTAHLVGREGLAALLEARGYRIRRIP